MRNGIIRSLFALGLTLTGASAQAQDPEAGEVSTSETTTTTVTTTSADTGGGSVSSGSTGAQGPLRLYGGLHFGGGGNVKVMPEEGDSDKADLAGLIGFQLGADYVMHQYFAIGGEFRLTSTAGGDRPDGVDRSDVAILLVDFDVKPRGRYQFGNIPLEVYGTLPLGLSIIAPKVEGADTKVNMNFGIGGGATYFFTDKIGVNAEMAGIFHWYRESIDTGFGNDFTVRNRLGQFYMFLNFVYAL
ncbi:MAG: hypothetical protein QM778_24035 [Myxococcales bacterium]